MTLLDVTVRTDTSNVVRLFGVGRGVRGSDPFLSLRCKECGFEPCRCSCGGRQAR